MERKVVEVVLWIHFIGLSLTCPKSGKRWFPILNCPDFFPPYESSINNMTLHNIFKCVHEADKDPNVKALVFHTDSNSGIKTCYLYDNVTEDCGGPVTGDYGLNKYLFQPINCGNGGSLSEDKLTCNCNSGYFGRHCRDLATDCADLRHSRGIRDRGEYSINLIPGQPPVTMTCHSGRTYVLYHSDTLYFTSFNRSWTEYRDGFSDNGNYWLGLKFLSYLTQERNHNKISFSAIVFNHGTGQDQYMSMTYSGFNVRNASTQFLMTNGGMSITTTSIGDILENLNNTPFSTYDNDNDNRPINCAMEYGGGWWYNKAGTYNRHDGTNFQYDCAPANPTGYFTDQCVTCNNAVKKINTGMVYGGKVKRIDAYIWQ